ncbi:hypothetical protein cyc_05706 [Cyclospora cayetanensis]|uniref:Uncharacterized protein n=1 Tax=Cyclospora cayetanensis TaxID=88456 RepID=A0A1D3CZ02_9EIME|nr:hypothetical protein cyc_05706 [Cyclospora cayetanensis]
MDFRRARVAGSEYALYVALNNGDTSRGALASLDGDLGCLQLFMFFRGNAFALGVQDKRGEAAEARGAKLLLFD